MTHFTPVYRRFIKSKAWKAKRLQVLKRDNYQCRLCGCSDRRKLQVDHFKYPPRNATFADFMDQPLSDLRVLCETCHKLKTQITRSKK